MHYVWPTKIRCFQRRKKIYYSYRGLRGLKKAVESEADYGEKDRYSPSGFEKNRLNNNIDIDKTDFAGQWREAELDYKGLMNLNERG